MRSRAATAALVLLYATMALAASAQDLITASEVQWHIESLGVGSELAEAAQALADEINSETSEMEAIRSEFAEWAGAFPYGSGMLYPGLGGSQWYWIWYAGELAAKEILRSQADSYFSSLAVLAGNEQQPTVAALHNAYTVGRYQHQRSNWDVMSANLRQLARVMFGEAETWPELVTAFITEHERQFLPLVIEAEQAGEHLDADSRDAWRADDFDAFLQARHRWVTATWRVRDFVKRDAERLRSLIPADRFTEFDQRFRNAQYWGLIPEAVRSIDAVIAESELAPGAQPALRELKSRIDEVVNGHLPELIELYEADWNLEAALRRYELAARVNYLKDEDAMAALQGSQRAMQQNSIELQRLGQDWQRELKAIQIEHGLIQVDPIEKLQVMSAPYAVDVPDRTDPTWRFFYSNPVFGRPDLERMLDACEATDDQRTLARAIYDDYRREVQEKAVELGRTVTELDAKREEFKRENPDAAQGEDWRIVGNEYGRLDSQWTIALTDFTTALWEDMETLFEESQRLSFDRAAVDALWERVNQQLRSGNMGGNERHLVVVVEDAFSDGAVPAEVAPILEQYRDELWAVLPDVQRRLKAVELEFVEFRDRLAREDADYQRKIERAMEPWMALMRAPADINASYRDLLLAAADEEHREILQRAFDKEVHPELFVASPIDLLARELEEIEAEVGGAIDQDRFDAARSILDNARAQYERNTRALMSAKTEWSGPGAEEKWKRWREDHSGPDPTMPGVDAVGPMDHLWDQRRDIAKNACATVARLFPPHEREALPAGIQLLLMWSEGK